MALGRGNPSHQLSRAHGSLPSSKNLPQGTERQASTTADGQSDGSSICKQSGWDHLSESNPDSQGPMDVVPREADPSVRPILTREGQCSSGYGVQGDEGSFRLEAEPKSIPEDTIKIPIPQCGPICLTPHPPIAKVFQIETRSPCRGNQRPLAGLERDLGLCKPSLEPSSKGPISSGGSGGRGGTSSPHLAVSVMVSMSAQTPGGSTPQNQTSERSNPGGSRGVPSRPDGRMEYLRKRYSDQQLSEEASTLLLSSWRQKSSQSYDSLCRKWISWCTERDRDPVSGPIEDVVNFLAHLHHEGYQYRSLNAYRSAIASMHTHVDGASVGQHPLVARLLKGACHARPPQPRYSSTWDVSVAFTHLGKHIMDKSLPLKQLTLRTVMLMALSRPSRSADLSKLDLRGYRNSPEGRTSPPFLWQNSLVQERN